MQVIDRIEKETQEPGRKIGNGNSFHTRTHTHSLTRVWDSQAVSPEGQLPTPPSLFLCLSDWVLLVVLRPRGHVWRCCVRCSSDFPLAQNVPLACVWSAPEMRGSFLRASLRLLSQASAFSQSSLKPLTGTALSLRAV